MLKNEPIIILVIPCFNEASRIDVVNIEKLIALTSDSTSICFVNDGSRDKTLELLIDICSKFPRCKVINLEKNLGKGNAIYEGVKMISLTEKFDYIGYFDADFSIVPTEIVRIINELICGDYEFVFGSKILLLNSNLQRKMHRHIISRVIHTIIDLKFQFKMYDTQCGAKIFSKSIIKQVFTRPFNTKWFFDIEIFYRIKNLKKLHLGKEIPVYDCIDLESPHLKFKSSFLILKEIFILMRLK